MNLFLHQFALAFPLFSLVFVGFMMMRVSGWPGSISEGLSRFVFTLALPALLFRLIGRSDLPPVDFRLLFAFFGGCLIVFILGRLIAWKMFRLEGVSQSVFAQGGIFSSNVLLGLPLAKVSLGDAAVPPVAMVLVFNSLILWTLVSVSVEWARHGNLSLKGLTRTARGVLTTPVILGILLGALFGFSGWTLPKIIDTPLAMVAESAAPMSMIALGMSLAEYRLRDGLGMSAAMCALKLAAHPLVVWMLAWLLGLPRLETQVAVLLASMSIGVNVYLMSRHFEVLEGPVASALLLSTMLAAITTPLVLALLH
jgi:predicted permease